MSDKTGGPAFPRGPQMTMNAEGTWPALTSPQEGMSLLDYFAAAALRAMAAEVEFPHEYRHGREQIADRAYDIAEAMLAEKARRER